MKTNQLHRPTLFPLICFAMGLIHCLGLNSALHAQGYEFYYNHSALSSGYPTGVSISDKYEVRVSTSDTLSQTLKSTTQRTGGNLHPLSVLSASWTHFAAPQTTYDAGVRIKVKALSLSSITSAVIRPLSAGVTTSITGNEVTFTITKPMKFQVDINNDQTHVIFIFADLPEVDPPSAPSGSSSSTTSDSTDLYADEYGLDSPTNTTSGGLETDGGGASTMSTTNTVYYGPGFHNVGENFQFDNDTTVYLAPGSFVNGTFRNSSTTPLNITVRGRGILCGRNYPWDDGPGLLRFSGSITGTSNLHVEGITFLDSPGYNCSWVNSARNLKMIGWVNNTDGVHPAHAAVVEDNFIFNYDDGVTTNSNILVTNNVFYTNKGATFKFSWNINWNVNNVLFKDNTVINYRNFNDYTVNSNNGGSSAVISAAHGGLGHLYNYTVENLRVERLGGSVKRFLSLQITHNDWETNPDIGTLSGLLFKNVTIDETTSDNKIIGYWDSTYGFRRFKGVKFENCTNAGTLMTDYTTAAIPSTNRRYLSDIQFTAYKSYGDTLSGWNKSSGVVVGTWPSSTNSCFHLNDTTTSSLYLEKWISAISTQYASTSFRFRTSQVGTLNTGFLIYDGSGRAAVEVREIGGALKALCDNGAGGYNQVNICSITANTNYKIRVITNMTTKKYDIYVNNTKYANITYRNTAANSIARLYFQTGATPTYSVYLDDVEVGREFDYIGEQYYW